MTLKELGILMLEKIKQRVTRIVVFSYLRAITFKKY